MEQGMEERRLSIYLGNRNALEILKLRGLYRTRISPPPPLPPISRCIQFYEGNRFALGFAPKKIHRALLYRGREFNEVSCLLIQMGDGIFLLFFDGDQIRGLTWFIRVSPRFFSFFFSLFRFIFVSSSSSYGRKLEGGSIVTERGSLFFFVRRMKINL